MTSATSVDLAEEESRVLEYFKKLDREQSHTKEIAEECGIARHTAAKYLSVLEAKGLITHQTVGNAKVWYPITRDIDVRTLMIEDFDDIIEVAKRIQDVHRQDDTTELVNLRTELRAQLVDDNRYCVGAESHGDIVGFIIGDERSWEFGTPERVGWIRILGVDPDHQNQGIGQLLGDEILKRFDETGVQRVRTIVGWDESDLLPFFHSLDFAMKEATVLEKKLDKEQDTNNE